MSKTIAVFGAGTGLRIDVWGDIGCPWCYIGKKRMEKAIADSPHASAIEVVHHSYELAPGISHEPVKVPVFVAQKLGVSVTQAVQMENQVATVAHAEGLEYVADRVQANTFDAHRVLHLAAEYGLDGQLMTLLQRELFSGRANVYAHSFLIDAAASLGIDRERVRAVLDGDHYADAVRKDIDDAARLGVTGVPFAVIGGRFGIPGAGSVDTYAKAIEQAWATTGA